MIPTPDPDTADPSGSAAPSAAWRLILAAAGRPAPAAGAGDAEAPPGPAWLVPDGAGGSIVGAAAPAATRPLLELYAPLCGPAPLVIGHLGQSLDGWIATDSGDSYYVTGPANVRHLHRLRALCDAVIVGAGTVERDDPQLTVRHVPGADPVRVVLDPQRRLDARRRVFAAGGPETLLVCAAAGTAAPRHGAAEVLGVPTDGGRLKLDALLAALRARGLRKIFVEGGGVTVSTFIEAGLLDRLHVAIAPLLTGRGRPGLALPARDKIAECLRPRHRVFTMGADVLYDCDLRARADDGDGDGALARVL